MTSQTSAYAVKAGAMGLGLAAGIAGMALALSWLIWVGVGFLVVAFLLRFLPRPGVDPS